ncbi:MAG: tRNA pseudouridine(55) synthase TruB [Candidatus Nitrosocaldaceae archaeon]|nr:MAG: tRNA pseudouridine(55) synthase TruB [Candidatus Nitrosocaldaceae archaeon]
MNDLLELKQFKNMTKIDDDVTDPRYGYDPFNRPINVLFDYGLIPLDKPPGPTSHEIVAWVRRILDIEKAGHSGTLDPPATGMLPIGLGEATKALGILLLGPKEYYAIARLHSPVNKEKLYSVLEQFKGKIYQRPPQRSAVKRSIRIREIYELELVEEHGRLLLLRVLCQAGTYVRKLIYDIGEVLGVGATMIELRRTRVSNLEEDMMVRMHELVDAYYQWKENNDDKRLREMISPIEIILEPLKSVVIRDSAVDALCHGAQLAVPGVLQVSSDLKKGDLVAIYTLKGEVVALAEALLSINELLEAEKGIAFKINRIIMKADTYPRAWKSKTKN